MPAIILSAHNVHSVKRGLRDFFPEVKSGHLSEALATAVGFNTHAALRTHLDAMDPTDPDIVLIEDELFIRRLVDFGFQPDEDLAFGIFPLSIPDAKSIFIETLPISGFDIGYKTQREKAWRNMMVATINAGLQKKLFSVRPNDNRWPSTPSGANYVFDFTFGNGIPALGSLRDIGHSELSIHVALYPTERGREFVRAGNGGFAAGEAFAAGWLERKTGAWLQTSVDTLRCRQRLLRQIAEVEVKPIGFGDRGGIMN